MDGILNIGGPRKGSQCNLDRKTDHFTHAYGSEERQALDIQRFQRHVERENRTNASDC